MASAQPVVVGVAPDSKTQRRLCRQPVSTAVAVEALLTVPLRPGQLGPVEKRVGQVRFTTPMHSGKAVAAGRVPVATAEVPLSVGPV